MPKLDRITVTLWTLMPETGAKERNLKSPSVFLYELEDAFVVRSTNGQEHV